MISQTTIGQLRDMHLGHLAEDIRERCEQAAFAELGFDAQIELLVDKEWHRRRDRNAVDRIRAAGFCYPTANILDIDYATERCLSKNNISLFAECGYLVNGRNLIIMGATGVGKTYLACALGCILQAQNPHFCKIFLPSRGWGILCPHEGVPDPVALTIEQQYVTVVH